MSSTWRQPNEWYKNNWGEWRQDGWHKTEWSKHNRSEDTVSCRDWNYTVGCRDWNDPVSCRDGDQSWRARGRQDNLAERLEKWKWTCTEQAADTDMNEQAPQASPKASPKAAPKASPKAAPKAAPKATPQFIRAKQAAPDAARRWLEGVTKKSDLSVAAQTRRAELHEVSCRDEPTQYGEGVEFFQGYQITRHWKDHNICMKWKRERAEIRGEVPVIFHDDPDEPDHFQPLIRNANGGPEFAFAMDADEVPWQWQSMVAHLRNEDIAFVVDGPSQQSGDTISDMASSCASWIVTGEGEDKSSSGGQQPPAVAAATVPDCSRPRTLVGCELVKTDRVDHKRHRGAFLGKVKFSDDEKLYVWEFMLKRNDGTVCYLHPNLADTKVAYYEDPLTPNLEVPKGGLGGSNGPGYFQKRTREQIKKTLRFDANKSWGTSPAIVKERKAGSAAAS